MSMAATEIAEHTSNQNIYTHILKKKDQEEERKQWDNTVHIFTIFGAAGWVRIEVRSPPRMGDTVSSTNVDACRGIRFAVVVLKALATGAGPLVLGAASILSIRVPSLVAWQRKCRGSTSSSPKISFRKQFSWTKKSADVLAIWQHDFSC